MSNENRDRDRDGGDRPPYTPAQTSRVIQYMNNNNVSAVIDIQRDWVFINMGEWRDDYDNTTRNRFQIVSISANFFPNNQQQRMVALQRAVAGTGNYAHEFIQHFRNLGDAEQLEIHVRTETPLPPDTVVDINRVLTQRRVLAESQVGNRFRG